MPNNHEEFMKAAIRLSLENIDNGGGPFGAVIVKDDKIIAQAANNVTNSNDPTAHAEVNAIRLAAKTLNTFDLAGCDIYTSCEPCPMCLGAIYWARPENIFFAGTKKDAAGIGFDDSFIYNEIALPFEKRKIHTLHISHKDSLTPFSEWKNNENKVEY